MFRSKVFLVGAGPGDNKLITVRGRELIGKADCIIYDYLVNAELLKLARPDCKLIYAGKKAGAHTLSQENINKLLVKESGSHRNIVRLKGGDPFLFGRGAEEALYLKKNNIDFEIVPGVTSAIAVPAYAGIPLTDRSRASTVSFITGHENPSKLNSGIDWEVLARTLGTLVFLMGVENLDLISRRLIASGKPEDTPVAVIRWGTMPKQKTVVGTLRNIVRLSQKYKMSPPAIIVVGETVGLRKELNWFEKKPLFAKRVIITRTREQASELSGKLRDLGAEVIEISTIRTVSLKADKLLRKAFSSGKHDWVFFTSRNGVYEFAEFLNRSGKDCRVLGAAKVCAIGSETARALRDIGIRPDYIPPEFVAESIVKHFRNMRRLGHTALRVLILRAKRARDILPEGLKKSGFNITIIDLYDTVVPLESSLALKEALDERVDIVTFTSSSTVENFIKLVGRNYRSKLSGVKLASIGPVTSGALKKFGLKVGAEAKAYTIDGLVEAILRHCEGAKRPKQSQKNENR